MKGFLGFPIRCAGIAVGLVAGGLLWQRPRGMEPGFLIAMTVFAFMWSITRAFFRLRMRLTQRDPNSIWGASLWTSTLPQSREGVFFSIALLFLSGGASSIGCALLRGYDPIFGGPLVGVGLGQLVGLFLFRRFRKSKAA